MVVVFCFGSSALLEQTTVCFGWYDLRIYVVEHYFCTLVFFFGFGFSVLRRKTSACLSLDQAGIGASRPELGVNVVQ